MLRLLRLFQCYLLLALIISGCARTRALETIASPGPVSSTPFDLFPAPSSTATPGRSPTTTITRLSPSPSPGAALPPVPYELVSEQSLFAYLEQLTSIQPYSGWRNSASSGEAEALDTVEKNLRQFSTLQSAGLELERQSFPVYLSTEIWSSALFLTIDGAEMEVPADGLRGSRSHRQLAGYFDSDGVPGDASSDPLQAQGPIRLVGEDEELYALDGQALDGQVLFLDYAVIDPIVNSEASANGAQLLALMERGLAGLVLVTSYSNRPGESRGTLLGDGAVFLYSIPYQRMPVLYVRIEDLQPAGIANWKDLAKVSSARLVLDADVFSPGESGNLVARIPGADGSKAVILGAHIDSPNGPGVFDDGSGSAALLEVARVLEVSRFKPSVDIYLAWFGGHEIGTYGSAYFASTHQDLLDRTLALVQMDGLGMPLDGSPSAITLGLTPYTRFGEDRQPLVEFLEQSIAPQGILLESWQEYGLIADNSNFDAFDVPNVYLGYLNADLFHTRGSTYTHYASHWHDPYETLDQALLVKDALVDMTRLLLAAALETGRFQPALRVTSPAARQALVVASHTATPGLPTSMLRELGMALSWEGFDVDLLPYGQAVTAHDLQGASIVILPPTLGYPGSQIEQWSAAELSVLENYLAGGGFLVFANSHCNYLIKRCLDLVNLNGRSLNPLLEPMGLSFTFGSLTSGSLALASARHPLTRDAEYLSYYDSQGIPFRIRGGLVLYRDQGRPLVALLDYGDQGGQALVLADLGFLQTESNGSKNLEFIWNIARYARAR